MSDKHDSEQLQYACHSQDAPASPEEHASSQTATLQTLDTSLVAWLQVLGGFLAMFNTWGIALSFGVFQALYEDENLIRSTPSAIAWIGSLQASLLLLIGGLCGRIFDAGYLRLLVLAGSFFVVFGSMMASLGHAYWQLLLDQSICVGVGMGCLLVPSVGTVGTWFEKHRGTAFGIVSSGGAFGGIVLPIMLQKLLDEVGFQWAMRTLGFVSLATLAVCVAVLRQRLPSRTKGALFEWNASGELDFALFTSGYFLVSIGFYVFPQFVQSWAIATHFAPSFATEYYLPIYHAASIPGRILPNLISDHLGPLNVQIPCIIINAIMVFAWLAVESLASMLIVAILSGFFSGALLALPLSVLAKLTKDHSRLGARMGVFFVCEAVGTVIGTPIGGAIIGKSSQGGLWDTVRIWSGGMMLLGAALIFSSRCAVSRRERNAWIKA